MENFKTSQRENITFWENVEKLEIFELFEYIFKEILMKIKKTFRGIVRKILGKFRILRK